MMIMKCGLANVRIDRIEITEDGIKAYIDDEVFCTYDSEFVEKIKGMFDIISG